MCTHIVYGFAVLDRDSLSIKPHDTWADFDNHFYERVVAYKKKGLKVTVAIGGWNDSAGDKYSRLVRNEAARARFIKRVIEFIEKHNFDGLDLDWEVNKKKIFLLLLFLIFSIKFLPIKTICKYLQYPGK